MRQDNIEVEKARYSMPAFDALRRKAGVRRRKERPVRWMIGGLVVCEHARMHEFSIRTHVLAVVHRLFSVKRLMKPR